MEPVIYLVVLAVIVVALICLYVSLYNGIVSARNRCDNAWQTIDTQLQRRNDLIPNLVETVKGYASHESNTLQEVTKARGALNAARTPQEKNGRLKHAHQHTCALVCCSRKLSRA